MKSFAAWIRSKFGKRQALQSNAPQQLWAGVEFKLGNAQYFLDAMTRAITPPDYTTQIAQMAGGAIVGNVWQEPFYANFDAFLATTRSVADIVQFCFGADHVLQRNNSFRKFSSDEQKRRKEFQKKFDSIYRNFKKLPLSEARNITLHRAGTPPIDVIAAGFCGQTYNGTPLTTIPVAETQPIVAGDGAAMQWAATQPPNPIRVTWNDFGFIQNGPKKPVRTSLQDECLRYLTAARNLVVQAKALSQAVHGNNPLTPPRLE